MAVRIVFLVGYLTGIVCFIAFSAAIVSRLSTSSDFVKRFEDLVENKFEILTHFDVTPETFESQVPVCTLELVSYPDKQRYRLTLVSDASQL
jgi:hypothetical protein